MTSWFFVLTVCQECDPLHTTADICDVYTGRCLCLDNFDGAYCDRCKSGFYRYPYCTGKKTPLLFKLSPNFELMIHGPPYHVF